MKRPVEDTDNFDTVCAEVETLLAEKTSDEQKYQFLLQSVATLRQHANHNEQENKFLLQSVLSLRQQVSLLQEQHNLHHREIERLHQTPFQQLLGIIEWVITFKLWSNVRSSIGITTASVCLPPLKAPAIFSYFYQPKPYLEQLLLDVRSLRQDFDEVMQDYIDFSSYKTQHVQQLAKQYNAKFAKLICNIMIPDDKTLQNESEIVAIKKINDFYMSQAKDLVSKLKGITYTVMNTNILEKDLNKDNPGKHLSFKR